MSNGFTMQPGQVVSFTVDLTLGTTLPSSDWMSLYSCRFTPDGRLIWLDNGALALSLNGPARQSFSRTGTYRAVNYNEPIRVGACGCVGTPARWDNNGMWQVTATVYAPTTDYVNDVSEGLPGVAPAGKSLLRPPSAKGSR